MPLWVFGTGKLLRLFPPLAEHSKGLFIFIMRCKTKYGNGTLIGVSTNNTQIGYKVLLDNTFNTDCLQEELEFNEFKITENRIYHCISIQILTDEGDILTFDKNIKIEKNDNTHSRF